MRRDYFSESARAVLAAASEAAGLLGQNTLGSEHLLLGLLSCPDTLAFEILTDFDLCREDLEEKLRALVGESEGGDGTLLQITPRAERILKDAVRLAMAEGRSVADSQHLLTALLKERESLAAKLMYACGVQPADVLRSLSDALAEEGGHTEQMKPQKNKKQSQTPTLDQYGRDLTQAAADGELDPIIGRDEELKRVIQILSRRTKNNPCLIGEPGVGKTAIAEGLAQKIHLCQVPESLFERRVVTLDLTGMLAGAKYRGEFEERIKSVLDEVQKNKDVILFIDEIHTLIGAGGAEGAIDAANILKPALARGKLQVIGATTLSEYRNIEKDAALERRFQPVIVSEPTEEEAILILQGLRKKYEEHHSVKISDEAIDCAVRLSARYISDRFLPDKAIDLIDEAQSKIRIGALTSPDHIREMEETLADLKQKKASAVEAEEYEQAQSLFEGEKKLCAALEDARREWKETKSQNLPEVTGEDIADIVTEWTHIPVSRLMEGESEKLLHLEEILRGRVVGQDEAVSVLSRAVRRARSGLKDPRRPGGSFIFAGPTGVGKTELCKALAEFLFGDESKLIRIDMSEYMEKHSVAKLIGSPPGYVGYEEGGELTEKVRRNPYSVLLFDEIEKAHPDVFHVLLQLLDDGRLTDSHGRVVDFKNTMVILTTNAGVHALQKNATMGFLSDSLKESASNADDEKHVHDALRRFFRPEFLNRIDEVVVFRRLDDAAIRKITRLLIEDLKRRLSEQGRTLSVSDAAVDVIAKSGFDAEYGARPLRRTIRRLLEDELATALLTGTLGKQGEIRVDAADGVLTFSNAA